MKRFDYSIPGHYVVTICAFENACLLGEVIEGEVHLSRIGKEVLRIWQEIPTHYPGVEIDQLAIMPNHFHGIIQLTGGRARGPAPTLGDVVKSFKSLTTKRSGRPKLWQRSYYEHIIRDEADLNHARRYIAGNPLRWLS